MAELTPVRIFFAHGPSRNMRTSLIAPGETDALAATPYRRDRRERRHLQSLDADGEGGEADYLDASDDPEIIRACSEAHTSNDELSLCETNGFESAWIMYDLGREVDLRALRLTTYKFGVPPPVCRRRRPIHRRPNRRPRHRLRRPTRHRRPFLRRRPSRLSASARSAAPTATTSTS